MISMDIGGPAGTFGCPTAGERLFLNSDFPVWFKNSIVVTILTFGRVFFDLLAGYALAGLRFRGRSAVFFRAHRRHGRSRRRAPDPQVPRHKPAGNLRLYFGMIIPLLADAAGVYIMKKLLRVKQAKVDGAGTFRTFWSIVLPMSFPRS